MLSGGAGSDTLVAELTTGTAIANTVIVSDVETMEFKVLSGSASVDTTNFFGVTKLISSGVGALTISPMSQTLGTSVVLVKKSGAANITANYPAPLTPNGNDSVTVEVQGSTGGDFILQGTDAGGAFAAVADEIKSVTVQSATGDTSVFRVVSPTATSLQVKGGGTVTIGPAFATAANTADYLAANFTNIDARDTAKATIALTLPAGTGVYRTGAGDDRIVIDADLAAAARVLDMGAGTDTLIFIASQTAATAGNESIFSGIEAVQLRGATPNALNLLNSTTPMSFELRSGGALTLTNAKADVTVQVTSESGASDTLGAVSVSHASSISGKSVSIESVRAFNSNATVVNAQTVSLNLSSQSASTMTGIALDDTNSDGSDVTKTLTITNKGSGATVTTGAITTASKLETLTATAKNGAIVLGALASASALKTIAITAEGGEVTMGAIGGTTASAALNAVTIEAKASDVVGEAITANKADGIGLITLKATEGQIGKTTPVTVTNTTGGITKVVISGAGNVTSTFNASQASGTGAVKDIDASTHTGSLTLIVTDGVATDKVGTTLKLGNAATGKTNTVTLDDGKDSVTGGSGVDNITSGAGADTLAGGAGADTLVGGAGADRLTGGADIDTFTFAVNESVASTANTFTAGGIAATNTVTFASGVDFITDFAATDLLDLTTAAAAPTTLLAVTTATTLTAGTSYVAYGTWNATTNVFTIAAAFNATTAKDALLVVDGNGQTAITTTGVVILDDLTAALAAANIV